MRFDVGIRREIGKLLRILGINVDLLKEYQNIPR
jgi:hypothetical protein